MGPGSAWMLVTRADREGSFREYKRCPKGIPRDCGGIKQRQGLSLCVAAGFSLRKIRNLKVAATTRYKPVGAIHELPLHKSGSVKDASLGIEEFKKLL